MKAFTPYTPKKGRAPLEALRYTAEVAVLYSVTCVYEALPFNVPLNLAGGTGDASIDEVGQCNECQRRSYHRAPSFRLTSDIDSRITSQVRIFVFTFEVLFPGIHVPVFSFTIGFDMVMFFAHYRSSMLFFICRSMILR